jgi:hypothetical protein
LLSRLSEFDREISNGRRSSFAERDGAEIRKAFAAMSEATYPQIASPRQPGDEIMTTNIIGRIDSALVENAADGIF